MKECKRNCKNFKINQTTYPCNNCERLIVLKDHYEILKKD